MGSEVAWAASIIERRKAERQSMLDLALQFVRELPVSLGLVAAVVFGSVARGDFNVWSDIDVLVVARNLPERPQDRLGMMLSTAPPGVQPIAWTPEEFVGRMAEGNPIARDALNGAILWGEESLRVLMAATHE